MNAYECDSCGKFFPGWPASQRYLPTRYQHDEKVELDLCKTCTHEFDKALQVFVNGFTHAKVLRTGHVKNDPGHEEG